MSRDSIGSSLTALNVARGVLTVAWTWALLRALLVMLALWNPKAASNVAWLGICEVLAIGGAAWWIASPMGWIVRKGAPPAESSFSWLVPSSDRRWGILCCVGVLLGVSLQFPGELVREGVEHWFPTPPEEISARLRLLRHDTWGQAVTLFLVIGLIGPLVEELFYRGALFERLVRGAGEGWAAGVTGVGFVVAHASLRDWPSLALATCGFTVLRLLTRSFWPCVAAHVAFNMLTLVFLVLDWNVVWSPVAAALGAGSALGLLVFSRRITRAAYR